MAAGELHRMPSEGMFSVGSLLAENQRWETALDIYLHENAWLKLRLAQVLDQNPPKSFTAHAEHFQTSFIHLDEGLKDLKKDIQLSKQWLKEKEHDGIGEPLRLSATHQRFQREMNSLQKNFEQIKNDFFSQVGELFPSNLP